MARNKSLQAKLESTIGAAFFTQVLSLNEATMKFDIWDTVGQERYHSLAPMYYRGAAAAIVVYDITSTCRKKHSYVCPSFEATGTCTQGTKCKLHHPKKQSTGKKRKRSGDQNNNSGRYFGSISADVSEPGLTVVPSHSQKNEQHEDELTDYISLDVYEEAADMVDQSSEL